MAFITKNTWKLKEDNFLKIAVIIILAFNIKCRKWEIERNETEYKYNHIHLKINNDMIIEDSMKAGGINADDNAVVRQTGVVAYNKQSINRNKI